MKALLFSLILAVTFQANAFGTDPRFSYDAAEAAYSAGRGPTQTQLTANSWRAVGVASAVDTSQDGYWPDGEMVLDGERGHFHADARVTFQSDAFGNPLLTWNETLKGAESKVVFYDAKSAAYLYEKTALVYQTGADAVNCATQSECRMVKNSPNLLCRMIVMDARRECAMYPRNAVNRYRMMMPLTK